MQFNANKVLLSIAGALATSKLARSVARLDANDLLGTVGLARRRSYFLQDAALLGAGAVIGAGVALLLAPSSGAEARAKIGKKIETLGEAATEAIREVRSELPSIQVVRHAHNESARERHEHHS